MLAHHTWLQPAPILACGDFDYDCTSGPLQFSWRGVAASAVGAGVGQAVGPMFGNAFGDTAAGQFGARLATSFVAGTAAAAMRGGRVAIQQVAIDAFGNALGNSIAQGVAGGGSQQAGKAPEQPSYGRWPDQTDAESARLARSGNAYGQWPDQAGAETARLAMYEDMARPTPEASQTAFRQMERDYRQATDTGAVIRSGDRLERLAGGSKEMMGRYSSGMGLRNMNELPVGQSMTANWDMSTPQAVAAADRFYVADGMQKMAASMVPAGTAGTAPAYNDMQRFLANSSARGMTGASGMDLIPRTGGYYAAPASAMTAEELRGQQIQQINRAFTIAKNNGDVAAMQRLSSSYQNITGGDPSSAMNVVMMGNVTARAKSDVGQPIDYEFVAPLATAAIANGVSGIVQGGPLWSSTKTKSSVENAYGHWGKHSSEFPELANSKQYVEAARAFANSPPTDALVRPRGADTIMYQPSTNTFVVRGADGAPKTMFRPTDGINYWNKQ